MLPGVNLYDLFKQIETEKPKESLNTTEKQMTWLKETVIRHLTETYGIVDNIENLITIKSNDFKDGKGEYSISFHAFCNELNKRNK